jgi:hypothetical protein
MQPKYCRYCNALVQPPEPGVAAPDFCNDEHRRQYQDKIQRETIERLRRADRSSAGAGSTGAVTGGSAAGVLTQEPQSPFVPPGVHPGPAAAKPAPVESTLAGLSRSSPSNSPAPASGLPPAKTDKDSLASLLRSARTKIAEKKIDVPAAPEPRPIEVLAATPVEAEEPLTIEIQTEPGRVAPAEPATFVTPVRPVVDREEPPAIESRRVSAIPGGSQPQRKSPPPVSAPPIRTRHVLKPEPSSSEPEANPAIPEAAVPIAEKAVPVAKVAPRPLTVEKEQAAEGEPVLLDAPVLGSSVGTGGGWMMKAAAAVVLITAGGGYYFWQGGSATATAARPKRPAVAPILMSPVGWSNTPGTAKKDREAGRTLTLYRPSLEFSDYRVNFTGEIEHRALGWVFRVKDPANYYAAKLVPVPGGKLKLVRWTVAGGVSSEQVTAPVDAPLPSNEKYKIQLEAKGPRFTLSVQGQQVDAWTDTTFASGGFGLANENTERGKVTEVQIGVFGSGH